MGTTFFCKIPFVGWVGQILVNFVIESKLYFLGTNGTPMVPKFFRDEKYVFWAFRSCIARMRMTSRSICRMFENLKILSNFCKQIDIIIFQKSKYCANRTKRLEHTCDTALKSSNIILVRVESLGTIGVQLVPNMDLWIGQKADEIDWMMATNMFLY